MRVKQIILALTSLVIVQASNDLRGCGAPPTPETIHVRELPLPPTSQSAAVGACSKAINPHGTGCIDGNTETFSGNFLPGDEHIITSVNFTGAPASPDPASIYSGTQIIAVKLNGTFANGDPWKCLTCGIPASQRQNLDPDSSSYPQAFADGKRLLAGGNIVQCDQPFVSDACTANNTNIYRLYWAQSANATAPPGSIREIRIHPDQVHLSFNSFTFTGGVLGENAYFGRLSFNSNPTTGSTRTPRYDLVAVTGFYNSDPSKQVFSVNNGALSINQQAQVVGEFRGFSGTGQSGIGTGFQRESCNIDLFGFDLNDGSVTRLTTNPGYADPVGFSLDGKWQVILDTRTTDRMTFIAGARGIPPVLDMVVGEFAASVRNNGYRRFFQPILLDRCGDRGSYQGQVVDYQGNGQAGAINDPNWNAMADPRWSWNGKYVAYHQHLVTSPDCGGANPIPCPVSTAQGGRRFRLMLAEFVDRQAVKYIQPAIRSETVPWGTTYNASATAAPTTPISGNLTLFGATHGYANVSISSDAKARSQTVGVVYHNFTNDGINVLNGYEYATSTPLNVTAFHLDWFSNLTSNGPTTYTKITSPGGYHVLYDVNNSEFAANGTLTTTINGTAFVSPASFT